MPQAAPAPGAAAGLRAASRGDFPHFLAIPTRWMDNDAYQHVNNVVYYAYFDTAVNEFLIRHGALDPRADRVVGLVVETGCVYFSAVSFPDIVHVGLRVVKLGNTSVRYELALFRNDDVRPAAAGHFVHVYVDRDSNRPVPIPAAVRGLLSTVQMLPA